MAKDPVDFALANPIPEILPEEAWPHVTVIATVRSNYSNQINNVLCFPGLFKGALDCLAKHINEEMKMAAAHAIADCIEEDHLQTEYIIPSVFDAKVVENVAAAVVKAARGSKTARRRSRSQFE
jgi:malate dehydrogenase (oxaloacetate-decarboxylating)